MTYRVGQRVQIRDWDDMAQEFGMAASFPFNIDVPYLFTPRMRRYCGKVAEVLNIDRYQIITLTGLPDIEPYNFSAEMLRPAGEKKIRIGDTVRFKSWNKLSKEFGVDRFGVINVGPTGFSRDMEPICGLIDRVKDVSDSGKIVFWHDNPKLTKHLLYEDGSDRYYIHIAMLQRVIDNE